MTTKILKRCSEDARVTFMLLRELLINCVGYTDIYTDDDGSGAFTASQTGVDGETDINNPQNFVAASGVFGPGDVGKYLVVCDPLLLHHNNVGIYKIVGAPNSTTLAIQGGLYGGSFTTGVGFTWRLMDPAGVPPALAGFDLTYVVQAVSGTNPIWQAEFYLADADTVSFRITVGPGGGYDSTLLPGIPWTLSYTDPVTMTCDVTSLWTILASDSYIRMYTEAVGGASVFNLGYVGACIPRRSAADQQFAVCFADIPLTALTAIKSVAWDGATKVDYSAIYYGDLFPSNIFTALPPSQFDLRNDSALIAMGCETAGSLEDDRGTLNGVCWISDSIPYKTFVDNSRRVLSLGSGISIEWDGTVGR